MFPVSRYFFYLLIVLLTVAWISCSPEDLYCSEEYALTKNSSISIDSSKAGRNVLIIGIDGFRSDAMQKKTTPFLYNLSKDSGTYFNDRHEVESIPSSGSNWASLLTGAHWCKHKVSGNDFNESKPFNYPSFFHYLESADSTIHTASVVNWTPINKNIISTQLDYSSDRDLVDSEVFEEAKQLLSDKKADDSAVLFLHFGELDAAGQDFGFSASVPEYAATLRTTDNYVNQLFDIVEKKREGGENWLIFIVSDHGGEGKTHTNIFVRTFWKEYIFRTILYAHHPSLVFDTTLVSSQPDLAPTLLDFMGINSPEFEHNTDGASLIFN